MCLLDLDFGFPLECSKKCTKREPVELNFFFLCVHQVKGKHCSSFSSCVWTEAQRQVYQLWRRYEEQP